MDDEIIRVEGEVVTPQDRIMQLQEEVSFLRGGGSPEDLSRSLSTILGNPGALKQMFGLTDVQAKNVRAFISGGGSGLALKYLGDLLGEELAAGFGGFLSAYLAKRIVK